MPDLSEHIIDSGVGIGSTQARCSGKILKSFGAQLIVLSIELQSHGSCFRPGNMRVVTTSYRGAIRTERKASSPGSAIFRTARFLRCMSPSAMSQAKGRA